MKYKCINEYKVGNITLMAPGDIIETNGEYIYNITKGIDYTSYFKNFDAAKPYLENISDNIPTVISDADRFRAITREMCETFVRKNHDYGNSFEQSLNEEGLAASRIRMGDKWNRFKSLSNGKKAKVSDESIIDTLLDLANYAIMTVMWIDKKHGNIQSV